MDQGILSFRRVHPDRDFIDEIFTFNVRNLESTPGVDISKYTIALAQWLVYYKSETNQTKVLLLKKQRILDGAVSQLLTTEILKTYKTKSAATDHIISSTQNLNTMQTEIYAIKDELMLLEGVDKTISELIAAFKRELTRRENELYSVRRERNS